MQQIIAKGTKRNMIGNEEYCALAVGGGVDPVVVVAEVEVAAAAAAVLSSKDAEYVRASYFRTCALRSIEVTVSFIMAIVFTHLWHGKGIIPSHTHDD